MMEKIIYSKRLAYELRQRGFQIIKTGINKNFPQYNTFIFNDSAELQKALAEITRQ